MNETDLCKKVRAKPARKRVGRGNGSGLGRTCGRGHKGQKSRSGGGVRPGFEGGQMPLFRRLPKRGFNNKNFRKEYDAINLRALAGLADGSEVTPASIQAMGFAKRMEHGIKLLGELGEKDTLPKGLKVTLHRVSDSARRKIEEAGGTVEELHPRTEKKAKKGRAAANNDKKAATKEEE